MISLWPKAFALTLLLTIITIICECYSVHLSLISFLILAIVPGIYLCKYEKENKYFSFRYPFFYCIAAMLIGMLLGSFLIKNEIKNNGAWICSAKVIDKEKRTSSGKNASSYYVIKAEFFNKFNEKDTIELTTNDKNQYKTIDLESLIMIGQPINYSNQTHLIETNLNEYKTQLISKGRFVKNLEEDYLTNTDKEWEQEQYKKFLNIRNSKFSNFLEEIKFILPISLVVLFLLKCWRKREFSISLYISPFLFSAFYQWYFHCYYTWITFPITIIMGMAVLFAEEKLS